MQIQRVAKWLAEINDFFFNFIPRPGPALYYAFYLYTHVNFKQWWGGGNLYRFSELIDFTICYCTLTPHNLRVCARWKVPAKCFKICHTFGKRKPMYFFSIFHFVRLYFFPGLWCTTFQIFNKMALQKFRNSIMYFVH